MKNIRKSDKITAPIIRQKFKILIKDKKIGVYKKGRVEKYFLKIDPFQFVKKESKIVSQEQKRIYKNINKLINEFSQSDINKNWRII